MEIKYLGHSSFLIKTKDAKIVTDPFDPAVAGIKFPKIEADLVTISHDHRDHNQSKLVEGSPLIVNMPGEFEKKGVRIFGFRSYHDKQKGSERGEVILYKFESEEISVLHCGDLGFVPEEPFIDAIGDVDVLMVPVGGKYTIDANEAVELIKKIEPSIVLPMHFDHPKLDPQYCGGLAPISEFLKKFGLDSLLAIPKLIVRKEELEQEMKIVTLEVSA